MDPDWNDLRVILALAEAGSVAGASRRLGVNGSTIRRRLAALEGALGTTLLVRGGREFRWTDRGERIVETARRFEALWADTARRLNADSGAVEGTVRLSTVASLLSHLVPVQMRLRERYPTLRLDLRGEDQTVDVLAGEADIAFRMFRPRECSLVCRRVTDLSWGVYASRDYVARCGAPVTLEELPSHYQLRYVTARHGVPALRWMDEHGGDAAAHSRINNPDAMSNVLSSGLGIGVLPRTLARRHEDLVELFEEPVVLQPGHLVYHESSRDCARVRAVIDAFFEYFRPTSGEPIAL